MEIDLCFACLRQTSLRYRSNWHAYLPARRAKHLSDVRAKPLAHTTPVSPYALNGMR